MCIDIQVHSINDVWAGQIKSIRKYNSTFYVQMGQIQNGHLYLKYGNSSAITMIKWDKTLTDKKPLLVYC